MNTWDLAERPTKSLKATGKSAESKFSVFLIFFLPIIDCSDVMVMQFFLHPYTSRYSLILCLWVRRFVWLWNASVITVWRSWVAFSDRERHHILMICNRKHALAKYLSISRVFVSRKLMFTTLVTICRNQKLYMIGMFFLFKLTLPLLL